MKTYQIKIVNIENNAIVADLITVRAASMSAAKAMFPQAGLAAGFRYAVFAA